jgi:hypothetical protein
MDRITRRCCKANRVEYAAGVVAGRRAYESGIARSPGLDPNAVTCGDSGIAWMAGWLSGWDEMNGKTV